MVAPRFDGAPDVNFRALPRFNPVAPDVAASGLSRAAWQLDEMASGLARIQSQRVRMEAEIAGEKAGQDLSLDPNSLPNEPTIAGQTYRDAAIRSHNAAVQRYTAQLELSREAAYNQIELDYELTPEDERNPVALQQRIQSWIEGTASTMPDAMRPSFTMMAANKAAPLVLRATKGYLESAEKQAEASSKAVYEMNRDWLLAHPIPANDAEQKAYDTALVQADAALKSMRLPEAERLQMRLKLQDDLRDATFLADFDRAADRQAYFERFVKTSAKNLGIDVPTQNRLAQAMQARLQDIEYADRDEATQLDFKTKLEMSLEMNRIKQLIDEVDPTAGAAIQGFVAKYGEENVSPDWLGDQIFNLGEAQNKLHRDQIKKLDERSQIFDLLDGRVPVNPNDASQRDKVQEGYDLIRKMAQTAEAIPGARVSSEFGFRKAPGPGASVNHAGMDFAAPLGSPFHAVRGGRVEFVGSRKGYGNVVEIRLNDGHLARYAHADSISVQAGQRVLPGQLIGKVGKTGNATGPNLHLEIRDSQNRPINPREYLGRPLSEEQAQLAIRDAMVRNRIVDKEYRNKIVSLMNGSVDQVAEASRMYAFLRDNRIDSGLTREEEAFLARVHDDRGRGMGYDAAIAAARRDTDPANVNLRQVSEKRVKELLKKPQYQATAQFWDSGWMGTGLFKGSLQAPETGGMKALLDRDWEEAFTEALVNTGPTANPDTAARIAREQLTRNWGQSNVTGRAQFMKYPPEKKFALYHNLDQDSAWIRRQLGQMLGAGMPAYKLEDAVLVVDSRTRQEAAVGQPSYGVMVKQANGGYAPLRRRFRPDRADEQRRVQAQRQREADRAVMEAKSYRQRQAQTPTRVYRTNMTGK